MEEKIIIQSKINKTYIWFRIIGICVSICDIIFIIWANTVSYMSTSSVWGYYMDYTYFEAETGLALMESIALILLATIFFILSNAWKNTELIVTHDRVYGKIGSLKKVDLPSDSISAVGTSIFKGISISTSSGKIKFWGISNRDEVYEEIKKILVDRQEKEIKVKATAPITNIAQEQSSADELKKFKDLLDSGVITQEEFDAKKKQLLGL